MKTILKTLALACVAAAVSACALLAPIGADDEARRGAKITLAAFEATQQALLIYGRLPTCDETGVLKLCKDRKLWGKIKAVDKAASLAIAKAAPVLNGSQADAGELAAAFLAIEEVKAAVREAQLKLKGPPPAPPGST